MNTDPVGQIIITFNLASTFLFTIAVFSLLFKKKKKFFIVCAILFLQFVLIAERRLFCRSQNDGREI